MHQLEGKVIVWPGTQTWPKLRLRSHEWVAIFAWLNLVPTIWRWIFGPCNRRLFPYIPRYAPTSNYWGREIPRPGKVAALAKESLFCRDFCAFIFAGPRPTDSSHTKLSLNNQNTPGGRAKPNRRYRLPSDAIVVYFTVLVIMIGRGCFATQPQVYLNRPLAPARASAAVVSHV